jgi:hypothetical protein
VQEAAPSSPDEACGKRVFIARTLCMNEQCAKPQFTNHPSCVRIREQERQRKERESNVNG